MDRARDLFLVREKPLDYRVRRLRHLRVGSGVQSSWFPFPGQQVREDQARDVPETPPWRQPRGKYVGSVTCVQGLGLRVV